MTNYFKHLCSEAEMKLKGMDSCCGQFDSLVHRLICDDLVLGYFSRRFVIHFPLYELFIEFKHPIVCLTSNSKLFLQNMYKYVCYWSVKTATMSMTSFYWPRSIKPSQQWLIIQGSTLTRLWLIIQGSTLTRLATNNCLTSFCFYLIC